MAKEFLSTYIEYFFKLFITVLLAIIGFFATQLYSKMIEVEKDVVAIRLKVTLLEASTISKEEVKEICNNEILKFHRGKN